MSQYMNMCSFCISINKIVNFLIECQYIYSSIFLFFSNLNLITHVFIEMLLLQLYFLTNNMNDISIYYRLKNLKSSLATISITVQDACLSWLLELNIKKRLKVVTTRLTMY